jgi:D-alanyl-D-alanine carboxypeptidase
VTIVAKKQTMKTYQIIFLLLITLTACRNKKHDNKIKVKEVVLDTTSAQDVITENTLEIEANAAMETNPEYTTRSIAPKAALVQKSTEFDADYLMGKFDPNKHEDFSTIETKYASKAGMRMRTDAYQQFINMYEAAKKDGISLRVISATRPFHHQKSIWEAKWNGKRAVDGEMLPANMESKIKAKRILRWSSMPGTSRHHWGTDIDLNDLNNSYFESGTGKKTYDWLTANATTYGFCQVYSEKGDLRPYGYEEEKWHWSYLPVSRQLTNLYKANLDNKDITGFTGSETAEMIDIKTKYVLGINPDCQ